MAVITSAASGNFSAGATWVGGVVPGPSDNARVNTGHIVTIDTNTTVIDIQAITTGRFTMANGVTLTANVIAPASVNLTLTIPVTTTCTIIGNLTTSTTAGSTIAEKTGTGVLNITGAVWGGSSTNMKGLAISSSGTVNIIGEVVATTNAGVGNANAIIINNGSTLNITGDVTCANIISVNTISPAITASANVTVNVTGNVRGGSASAINLTGASSVLNVTGNIIAPLGTGVNPSITMSGQNATVSIIGNVYAGIYGNGITLAGTNSLCTIEGSLYANDSTITTSAAVSSATVIGRGLVLKGDFYYSVLGGVPYKTNILKVNSTVNGKTVFYDTSGGTYTRASLTAVDFDIPLAVNVRQGIVYGDSTFTGTLIVPSPSNVRKGVPTDATVGTADLSAADMWDYLTSAITTSGSIGQAVKDIKTKTDNLPDYPASVDAVGAIVASYNV
jgi:hypothetical protein